jgi:hypothetical protein
MPKRNFTPKDVAAVDAWYWAHVNKIQLQAGVFTTAGHEYQIEPMQSTARVRVVRKGAQMGFSEVEVLRSLHGQINGRYPTGVLYLFPTGDDVSDFSRARFNPLIANNLAAIGRYVRSTDSVNIKQIGSSMLYLRSARATTLIEGLKKDASKLRSVPADKTVFDEVDLMDPAMIDEALERMSHSTVKEEAYLSTPSIPDYGIDARYSASDQRVWMIRCEKCGHDTCLELSFPDCLKERPDGTIYRACLHCGAEIYPRNGRWVPQYPGREIAGYWISQLNSLYVEPGSILKLYQDPPNGNLQEVYNSKLAMAYIAAENRLTPQDVYACCGQDTIARGETRYRTAMGVDVGSELHVVIGRKMENGRKKIHYVGRVAEFSDLHDLADRFNVAQAVIDLYPETRKVREFQKAEKFPVFGCQYLDQQTKEERVDEEAGVLTYARTELCDMTHNAVMKGTYELPRRCPELEIFATQMSNMAKVLEEDERRGMKVYRYRKLGPDHYRHATGYFELAVRDLPAQRTLSLNEQYLIQEQELLNKVFGNKQEKYDPLTYGLSMPSGGSGGHNPFDFGSGLKGGRGL